MENESRRGPENSGDVSLDLFPQFRKFVELLVEYKSRFPNREPSNDDLKSFVRTAAILYGDTELIKILDEEY